MALETAVGLVILIAPPSGGDDGSHKAQFVVVGFFIALPLLFILSIALGILGLTGRSDLRPLAKRSLQLTALGVTCMILAATIHEPLTLLLPGVALVWALVLPGLTQRSSGTDSSGG